jgi:transcriptional regulator with GAF, ATPase, and Fis domain
MAANPTEALQQALGAVARAIAQSLSVREVWDRVTDACRAVAPFDAMGIIQIDGPDRARAIAAAGDPAAKALEDRVFPRAGYSPAFWPDADDFMVLIGDAERELDASYPVDRLSLERGYRSALRVPLSNGSRRLGSVLLVSRTAHAFTPDHGRALRVVAELIAIALSHQQFAIALAEESRRAAIERERSALLEQRMQFLVREIETLSPHRAIGDSKPWRECLAQAARVGAAETTVLLTGESGTGKEVVARLIHRGSPRSGGPFVALNCAALAEHLLESELFGHEKGAFTGAHSAHAGRIEQAAGGTLFLDEVAEMSPPVQAKFLRVLQEREYQRLGGTRTLAADVRVVAATNRDLKASIARGTFREDLYYRIAVFDIALPPLRARTEDIPLLVSGLLEDIGRGVGRPAAGIAPAAVAALQRYRWPGNVRELRNALERAVILCEGGMIEVEHLPRFDGAAQAAGTEATAIRTIDSTERELIEQALAKCGDNKSKAARLLGITRAQLRARIEKYGLGKTD